MTGEYGVYFPCAGLAHHLGCRIGPQGQIQDACMLGGLAACPSPGFFWNFKPSEVDSETISVSSLQFHFLQFLFCDVARSTCPIADAAH